MSCHDRVSFLAGATAWVFAGTAAAQSDYAWSNAIAYPPSLSVQVAQPAVDPATGRLVLLRNTGAVLEWTGKALTTVATGGPQLTGAAAATSLVAGHEGVLVFGGRNPFGTTLGLTLLYTHGTWQIRFPSASPPARTYAAMATLNGQPVLFGGIDASGVLLDDLWVFASLGPQGKWLQATGGMRPPARHRAALCPDGNGGLLLCGGVSSTGMLQDTWRLDSTFVWSKVSTAAAPAPRFGPMSYDPVRNEIVHVDLTTRVTSRFDPATSAWQALPADPLTVSVKFSSPTTGGFCYMGFDEVHSEHVFVDLAGPIAVLGVADARIGRRQPAVCASPLGIAVGAGTSRLGSTYRVDVSGAAPGRMLWLATGTDPVTLPLPVPAGGCIGMFRNIALLDARTVSAAGDASFKFPVPRALDLVGFEVLHQAMDPVAGRVSDELVVDVAR